MEISLTSSEHVESVCENVWKFAKDSLKNTQRIKEEVKRVLGTMAYVGLTPEDIIEFTADCLISYGEIITDQMLKEAYKESNNVKKLTELFETYFKEMGSMCAIPQE